MKRDLSRKFFYFPIKRAAKRPGFRRFKRFRGFRGEGIAFGDEYEVSVTGFPLVSPVLHDEEQKPPFLRKGVAP